MLKNHHYSKWALAKSMYVAPFIVFLLLLNCKHTPQEEFVLEENNAQNTTTEELIDPDAVITAVDDEGKPIQGVTYERTEKSEDKKKETKSDEIVYSWVTDTDTKKTKDKKAETFPDDAVFSWVTDIDIIDGEEIHNKVDEMPQYPGGIQEFYKSIRGQLTYPQEARNKGIEGTVHVEFVVTKEGAVSNVRVIKGVDPLLDAEAVRIIKMSPKWKPGKVNGESVSCYYHIPMTFSLQ